MSPTLTVYAPDARQLAREVNATLARIGSGRVEVMGYLFNVAEVKYKQGGWWYRITGPLTVDGPPLEGWYSTTERDIQSLGIRGEA